jgi:FixJ family two-component response regulator
VSAAQLQLVYVVEDDGAVRESTCLLLEVLGFAVREFASAEDYLAAGDDGEVACLILDFHLPGMSGLDLLEMLRGKGITTPAILVSADGKRLAKRAAQAGAAAILHKPLAADALVQRLAEILK